MGTTVGNEEVSGYFSWTLLWTVGIVQILPPLPGKRAGRILGPAFLLADHFQR